MVQLTVVAQRPSVGRHATVAGEALPLLQAHPLVGARVLLARGAGPCKQIGKCTKKKRVKRQKEDSRCT